MLQVGRAKITVFLEPAMWPSKNGHFFGMSKISVFFFASKNIPLLAGREKMRYFVEVVLFVLT